MKKLYVFKLIAFSCLIVLMACDNNSEPKTKEQSCSKGDVFDLPWLQQKRADIIEHNRDVHIELGKYQGREAFAFVLCCTNCLSTPPPIFDCAGNHLVDADYSLFDKKMTVYQNDESDCGIYN